MQFAPRSELESFLSRNPDIQLLEVLMPDFNGLLRCKRIQRQEFAALFDRQFSVPRTVPLLAIRGDMYDGVDPAEVGGDPDQLLLPLAGTLARIPWYDTPVAQVLTAYAGAEGQLEWVDPRSPLQRVLDRYAADGLHPVVATELEFYLLAPGDTPRPQPLLGKVPGTSLRQTGIQYCMADDLFDCDAFLNDVRAACEIQDVPLTAIHSEFSPGQWEINTHHRDDAVLACTDAMLLRRIVKGVARRHGLGATFMAKPFDDTGGSGMHIHASVYDSSGVNIFADPDPVDPPRLMPTLLHAVAGLEATVNEAMAIFAPNPNSYRRFRAGAFAPASPSWGYDHREVGDEPFGHMVENRIGGSFQLGGQRLRLALHEDVQRVGESGWTKRCACSVKVGSCPPTSGSPLSAVSPPCARAKATITTVAFPTSTTNGTCAPSRAGASECLLRRGLRFLSWPGRTGFHAPEQGSERRLGAAVFRRGLARGFLEGRVEGRGRIEAHGQGDIENRRELAVLLAQHARRLGDTELVDVVEEAHRVPGIDRLGQMVHGAAELLGETRQGQVGVEEHAVLVHGPAQLREQSLHGFFAEA